MTATTSNAERIRDVSPVVPGDVVDGKYCVEELLAKGGMGVIVRARHLVLEQDVALKFMLSDGQVKGARKRFLREARALSRIESPHIVRVFDCGSLAPNDVPYMAMEFLRGRELAKDMRQRDAYPSTLVVDIVLQALAGVAEAHRHGIVHRDLKPSNLFLCERPGGELLVKVLDFGISKVQGVGAGVEEDLTATGMVLGSPRYMAPEQLRHAASTDERADIWSLGVLMHHMLVGKLPFAGDSIGEVVTSIIVGDGPVKVPPETDVPDGLDTVVERCLQRDRDMRYANAAQLAEALEPFASSEGRRFVETIQKILGSDTSGRPTKPPVAAPSEERSDADVLSSTRAAWEHPPRSASSEPKRSRLGVGSGGLAVVTVFAGWLWSRQSNMGAANDTAATPSATVEHTRGTTSTASVVPSVESAGTSSASALPSTTASSSPSVPPAAQVPSTTSASSPVPKTTSPKRKVAPAPPPAARPPQPRPVPAANPKPTPVPPGQRFGLQ